MICRRFLLSCLIAPALLGQTAPAKPAAPLITEEDEDTPAAARPDPSGDRAAAEPWGRNPVVDRLLWERDGKVGTDGKYPPDSRMRAFRHHMDNEKRLAGRLIQPRIPATAIPGSAWTAIGPRPLQSGGPITHSGRVTVLVTHPTDGNIVYAGTATGGVWKTLDGGLNWIPLTDLQPSLATGAIALAPGNPDTIFVGTGEPNFSCDSHFGVGILKSTDGGYTWSQLGASVFSNKSISRIVIDPIQPLNLWAATTSGLSGFICAVGGGNSGIYKSVDGGVNWSNAAFPTGDFTDLLIDPANPLVLYAARRYGGIYKTTNGGANWGSPLAGGLPSGGFSRIDLAMHPTATGTLYAIYTTNSATDSILGIYKSVNAGAAWAPLPLPQASWLCISQCFYDLVLEVAPDGELYEGSYRLVHSADDGANWAINPDNYVDHHAVAFGVDGRIWAGNDGGIDLSSDDGTTWVSRNSNIGSLQFYPGASLHPANGGFAIAGSQDNGTAKFTGSGIWTKLLGGDGGASAIDFTNPDLVWYASLQFLQVAKTANGGTFAFANTGLTDSNVAGKAPFMAPLVMCPNNAQVLIAGSDNVWRSNNGAANWSANSADPLLPGASIRALAFDRTDLACGTYYAGLVSGKVFRTTSGGGAAAGNWVDISTGLTSGHGISDLSVDPGNANVVYAAITGFGALTQVYKTSNALAATPTWSSVSAGLPNIPVNAVLVDPGAGAVVYAGTDLGVYRSIDSGASWQPFMTGHPVVPVHDLQANTATGTLISFTHGRGAFKLELPQARPVPDGKFIPGLPLRASKGAGSNLKILFDNASCTHGTANVYWGNLTPAELAAYAYSGQECGVVSGGTVTTVPAATSAFFIVAGTDGSGIESGNTQDSAGAWHGSGVGRCTVTAQSISASCP